MPTLRLAGQSYHRTRRVPPPVGGRNPRYPSRRAGPRGLARAQAKPNVTPMSHPLSRLATRVAYASRQLPRMAWYAGHLYVMRRLAEQVRQAGGRWGAAEAAIQSSPRAAPERRHGGAARAGSRQCRGRDLSRFPPIMTVRCSRCSTARGCSFATSPTSNERRKRNATHEVLNAEHPRPAPGLLPAEFPFSVGRLADRGIRRPLRHAGRGAVQGNGQYHAAAGAASARGSVRRTRSAQIAADRHRLRDRALPRFRQASMAAVAGARP